MTKLEQYQIKVASIPSLFKMRDHLHELIKLGIDVVDIYGAVCEELETRKEEAAR